MTQPRAACILNPTKIEVERMRELCREYEARFGYGPTEFIETTVDDAGTSQTQSALESDVSLVIVAGGDGTVRLAAEVLAGTDVPLAIIPLGTGNLLARGIDVPTSGPLGSDTVLHETLEIAFGGAERHIDLVRTEVERPDGARETLVYSVIAGVGIDAGMISNTSSELKRRIGWLAYGVGIVQWLFSSGSFRARYRIDRRRTMGVRAASVMVGNSGTLTGGLVLMRDALIDDGLIDLVVMRPRGPLGWPVVAAQVLAHKWRRGRSREDRMVAFNQGRSIVLRLDSRPEEFQVDGDTVGEISAARFTAMPLALRVRCPHPESKLSTRE